MPKAESAAVIELPKTEPAPANRPLKPLPRAAFKLRESTNNIWRCVIPHATPRESLIVSDLFRIVAGDLHPFDKIIAVSDASDWYAELLVLTAGQGHASLVELFFKSLPRAITDDGDLPANHVVEHLGPETLWAVRRLSDDVMLGTGFTSRNAAVEFLLAHASLRS